MMSRPRLFFFQPPGFRRPPLFGSRRGSRGGMNNAFGVLKRPKLRKHCSFLCPFFCFFPSPFFTKNASQKNADSYAPKICIFLGEEEHSSAIRGFAQSFEAKRENNLAKEGKPCPICQTVTLGAKQMSLLSYYRLTSSAQSLHSIDACSNTVSVAFFCLSGG